ncbi:class I SAM-dependent methyltransferase [Streptomyces malaysiensis]|uniref:Class I SAM-dependent methyltransferase n=1 Tax=Streptomyces malaysiensis subsp. samsunensis TaxID=459658 RepID=A0A9X2RW69_STRMQ|nr:class I SAM-dependent methyltransferase [Streptomyces samsunensis]MCQ8830549.1 class I SAM-dependent methyltransferase [Streptomyces samsunensis]
MEIDYWNPNVHYHPWILDSIGDHPREALDIGCGDGRLVRALADRVRHVTGLDSSAAMVEHARSANRDIANADFVEGDVFDLAGTALPHEHYDVITMVAVAHHLGTDRAIRTAASLLAPGGRLVVVGLAAPRSAVDWLALVPALLAIRREAKRHGGKRAQDGLPVAEPDMTWSQVRHTAHLLLPGSRWRRRLMWRYSLLWEKPGAPARRHTAPDF